VSVFEEGGVFESEAEEAVDGDVGDPYERDRCREMPVLDVTN